MINTPQKSSRFALFVVCGLMCPACDLVTPGSSQDTPTNELGETLTEQPIAAAKTMRIDGQPGWLDKGTHRDGDVLYGVGRSGPVSNPALAKTTAENRARHEIALLLKPEGGEVKMTGVVISDTWNSPTGEIFVRAKMTVAP